MIQIRSREQYKAMQAETVADIITFCAPEDASFDFDLVETVSVDLPKTDEMLLQLTEAIKDIEAGKAELSRCTIAELAMEYDGLSALAVAFETIPSPLASFIAPYVETLRDVCVASGARRGVLLFPGNDPHARYWAYLLAAQLLSMTLLAAIVRDASGAGHPMPDNTGEKQ